jgi:hypothetical protein
MCQRGAIPFGWSGGFAGPIARQCRFLERDQGVGDVPVTGERGGSPGWCGVFGAAGVPGCEWVWGCIKRVEGALPGVESPAFEGWIGGWGRKSRG